MNKITFFLDQEVDSEISIQLIGLMIYLSIDDDNALWQAFVAIGCLDQNPINRYEHIPTNSQKIKKIKKFVVHILHKTQLG